MNQNDFDNHKHYEDEFIELVNNFNIITKFKSYENAVLYILAILYPAFYYFYLKKCKKNKYDLII